MDIETSEMIGATLILIMLVTMTIMMTLSQVKNLSEVSTDWTRGEGKKIAGSFHVLNHGQAFGRMTESELNSIKNDQGDGYCGNSIPGFRKSEPLKIKLAGDSCNELHRPVRFLLYVEGTGEQYPVMVGGEK